MSTNKIKREKDPLNGIFKTQAAGEVIFMTEQSSESCCSVQNSMLQKRRNIGGVKPQE